MQTIFDTPSKDLGDIFQQTAITTDISSTIIEKDFWLVRALQFLFSDRDFLTHHVFKGGTSLSKCFGLIQRFSEDLDITISRELLGFHETLETVSELSNKKQKSYFDNLQKTAVAHVKKTSDALSNHMQSQLDR